MVPFLRSGTVTALLFASLPVDSEALTTLRQPVLHPAVPMRAARCAGEQ
jgi:hypothetical protein